MNGETIRSWGQGRHPLAIIDDFIIGIDLVTTAILMTRETAFCYCGFCASFAGTVGLLYGSFTSKLVGAWYSMNSNIDNRLLIWLFGLAFAASIAGLLCSLYSDLVWTRRNETIR